MKALYTRLLPATAVAVALSALSFGALAQTPPAPSTPPAAEAKAPHHAEQHQRMQQRMQARHAEHQERLKASLQLTPQQEPAWNAFVARMQAAQRPAGQPRFDREAWKQLSTPQRLDRIEAMKAERDRAIAQRHDAIRSFYAQLNPAQQKAFDAQHQGMGPMHTGMKREHGRHMREHRQGHGPRM